VLDEFLLPLQGAVPHQYKNFGFPVGKCDNPAFVIDFPEIANLHSRQPLVEAAGMRLAET
jgi:hypothetical protein